MSGTAIAGNDTEKLRARISGVAHRVQIPRTRSITQKEGVLREDYSMVNAIENVSSVPVTFSQGR